MRVVVVEVADDVDPSNATLSRIIELLTPLGVFVSADEAGADPGRVLLAHIMVTRVDSRQLQLAIRGAHAEQVARLLPLASGHVDEPSREAIATMCASGVQALLEGEPRAEDLPPPSAALAQAPAPPSHEAQTPAPEAPKIVSRAESTPSLSEAGARKPATNTHAARFVDREAPPAAPPPDPRNSLGFGYESFEWGGGRLLHGPRLHASHTVLSAGNVSLGLGAEAAFSWPSNASERLFDLDLSTWSLRGLAEPSLQLTKHWALALPLGPILQVVSAKSSGGSAALALSSAPTRLAPGFAVRPTVTLTLSRSWSIALAAGFEFSLTKIRYGVSHPDGFTTVLASSYVRPSLCLDFAFHT